MTSNTIFVVNDEESIRQSMALMLKRKYRIDSFPSAETALKALQRKRADLILLDVGEPTIRGIDALKLLKKKFPELVVVVIAECEQLKTALSAMKQGAHDYVIRRIHQDKLESFIAKALKKIRMRERTEPADRRAMVTSRELPSEGAGSTSVENQHLKEALHGTGVNAMLAAKLVGMGYYAFRYRKSQLGIGSNPAH